MSSLRIVIEVVESIDVDDNVDEPDDLETAPVYPKTAENPIRNPRAAGLYC
jgi:hypothetical protein